jgi:branched-chain amino acid transport system permease protein
MVEFLQQVINGLIIGSTYSLMALGIALIFGIMHIPNFSLGALFMIGAFLSYYIVRWFGYHFYLVSIPVAMVIAAVLAILTEKYTFRKVKNAPHSSGFIVALAVYMILEGISVIMFGDYWRDVPSPFTGMQLDIGLTRITIQRLLILVVAIVLSSGVYLFIMKTKAGKMIRAMSQNPDAACLMGIEVNRMTMLVFAIGGSLAAATGVLIAPTFMVAPPMGLIPVTKAFVVVILGGMGSIQGAIFGGFMIGIIETMGMAYISSMYRDAFVFGVLVLVLIFKPTGLFNR